MSNPTLIFAPGAWYPPTSFNLIIDNLLEYRRRTVTFPSIQSATRVPDLQPDIDAVLFTVDQEAEEGHDIVVILHIWAGVPGSSALDGLSKSERRAKGRKGGIVKLLFIAAFIPILGESLVGAFGGKHPSWFVRYESKNTVTANDPHGRFFHDVPNGAEWDKSLGPHAWATKIAPATGTAYRTIPCAYLLCKNDRAIPFVIQQMLIDRARVEGPNSKLK
ncbi:uncharacterized protein N7496_006425 [Penicillium cataractarum]|uniref:AB hydrolase-1 domain-containing protein n=1 Tax=Penicillium cataractarum TaxID=2100454 RepID=A0A9W9S658_9EURO|nr:uncharacterized protein N7496_006425 [Penicillium cataractarum]KAJ5370333.1 hypothetical protein N7496_006425 [Penicillium cataractarum]